MTTQVMASSSSSSPNTSSSDTNMSAQAQAQQQSHSSLLQPDMAASTPSSSTNPTTSSTTNNNNTSQPNNNRQSLRRSLMSTRSHTSQRSRPASSIFPVFPSSLSYALVRDFAYPQFHPLHFGPSPEPASRASSHDTSAFSTSRRLSDPPPGSWDPRGWGAGPWGGDGGANFAGSGDQLPSTSFDDGEDSVAGTEKLAKNHRKSKSAHEERGRSTTKRGPRNQVPGLDNQGFFAAPADDDDEEEEEEDDDDQDESSIAHNKSSTGSNTLAPHRYTHSPSRLSTHHQNRLSALSPPFSDSSDPADLGPLHHLHDGHSHRPTSTSLDESFAGESLALYNFIPENSNELALREGQIIQVGYRHGQGWLVAMDMESGEQGLVPEEYVRLLSEIEGWGDQEHLEGVEEGDEDSAGFEDEVSEEVQHKVGTGGHGSQKSVDLPVREDVR
jgi:hypothetical protein